MQILKNNEDGISFAANELKKGNVVAIPTETVYGLAANALDPSAVAKIFKAKGRPSDNPLIVHISDISDMEKYANPPQIAYTLAEKFWPGPLTLIMPKKDCVPLEVTAGLNTVAIRMPEHETARHIISACGLPLAAPSANISGKPSPTSAQHVIDDFNDNQFVSAIVDGGKCKCGVGRIFVEEAAIYEKMVTIQSTIRKTAFSRLLFCSCWLLAKEIFIKYIHFSKLNACIL